MSDSTFEALSNIAGHISSFSASTHDGKVIHSSTDRLEETEKASLTAFQLLTDATLLGKKTAELEKDKLKRVTVTFPSEYHAFTLSNDIIYGIERTNNTSSQ